MNPSPPRRGRIRRSMNEKAKKAMEEALDDADFSNVLQAKTAWQMGFEAAWELLNRKHVYWAAGEPDCPRDIKARNGELHTLRCKVCGLDGAKGFCTGELK